MILLCYEKLYEVIEAFEQATGWKIVLWDCELRQTVVTPYAANPFCCTLQSRSGNARCQVSDRRLLDRCRESCRVEMHTCHAGFTDLCVPLLKGERLLGFLMFGQIRLGEAVAPASETLALFSDREEAMRLFMDTPVVSEEKLFAIVKVATMLASYILAEQMIGVEQSETAERLARYVEEHLTEPLTVDRIARDLHLSRSALYRLFDHNVGTGVKNYVAAVRMERAKQLLAETAIPIGEVGARCGIASVHYFCRVFKQKTGKTPLEYRNIMKRR